MHLTWWVSASPLLARLKEMLDRFTRADTAVVGSSNLALAEFTGNDETRPLVRRVCEPQGCPSPETCTPIELMEGTKDA